VAAGRSEWRLAAGAPAGSDAADPTVRRPSASFDHAVAVQALMWRLVGLFRTAEGLTEAVTALDAAFGALSAAADRQHPDAEGWRRLNLVTIARLIARAALRREESRGGHFRADFPQRDDLHWKAHLVEKTV
jgi:L-aspartate oxidase